MKPTISPRMIAWISHQLAHGRPLHALFIANEYLEPGDQLHRAFRAKARAVLGSTISPSQASLLATALDGRVISSLASDEKLQLCELNERWLPPKKPPVTSLGDRRRDVWIRQARMRAAGPVARRAP